MRVILIEDEEHLRKLISIHLRDHDIVCHEHEDVPIDCRDFVGQNGVIILDLMLPSGSGMEYLPVLKRQLPRWPVLILTALDQQDIKLKGFDLGADDYLTKPFDPQELLARIRALYKRSFPDLQKQLQIGACTFDLQKGVAFVNDKNEDLTDREIKLLQMLWEKRGEIVSRDEILGSLWGNDENANPRTIDNMVSRFRRLVGDEDLIYFQNVRGVGYRLKG